MILEILTTMFNISLHLKKKRKKSDFSSFILIVLLRSATKTQTNFRLNNNNAYIMTELAEQNQSKQVNYGKF